MAYRYGATLTRAQLEAQQERDRAHAEAIARAKAKERRRVEAEHALRETIRAAKALKIPPHPDGWKHRLDLERELSIYHNRKQASK